MPTWVWWPVLGANVVAFVLFAWDKRRARRGGRRVPEATLLWALFATGCGGAWLAMKTLRHKTRKTSFRWRAVALTALNPLWLLLWWSWSTAAAAR
ncbi:MAG: DUF1294 domain-containing protein [Planctomycetota bacterium]